jgi:hypothetical protein
MLGNSLLILTASYLNPREQLSASQLCQDFRQAAMNPCLWREIQIFNKQSLPPMRFAQVLSRSTQLRVLCLKFCPNICGDTLGLIAEHANPFFLRELYLDGCDRVNDQALYQLV